MAILYAYADTGLTAQAGEAAIPVITPAAGFVVPLGRRCVIHNLVMDTRKNVTTYGWLSRNAVAAANHIAALIALSGETQGGDTYIYIDATAAAVTVLPSMNGNNAVHAGMMIAGMIA